MFPMIVTTLKWSGSDFIIDWYVNEQEKISSDAYAFTVEKLITVEQAVTYGCSNNVLSML